MIGHASKFHHAKRKDPPNKSLKQPEMRHAEPNRQALYTTGLQKQHRILMQSIVELERDLDQLNLIKTETSDKLDHERWALHMELEKLKMAQLELVDNDLTTSTILSNDKKVYRVAQCDAAIDRLLQSNQELSNGIQASTMGLHEVGTSEISTNEDKSLDQLRHRIETSHKDFIMSEIDLESQIAAVQVLEKEMGKLNGLPQLLPILRSSIKDYEAAIKKDRQAIARVDNDRLSACIADAAEASLTAVVRAHGMKSASASNNNVEKLDKMTKLLVEQAAVNQLLLYILEIEEELLNERTDHQRAFLLDIEELSHQMDPPPSDIEFISNEDEENFLSNLNRILSLQLKGTDDLLDEVMEPQSEDLPAIVQLERLKNEIEGTKDRMEISMERIEQMMLDSQNAIEVIEKFSEVYINDQETDTHIPEETQQLHEQLENFVNDLQNEIQRFQKETTDSGELAEKKRRFSLFWTDQSLFEKEFGSM